MVSYAETSWKLLSVLNFLVFLFNGRYAPTNTHPLVHAGKKLHMQAHIYIHTCTQICVQ